MLRHWRQLRGLTQKGLAARIGMRRNTIWLIETGHPTRPRTARLLAAVLEVQLAALTDEGGEGGIRTHEGLHLTRFPGERHKPD
jgi:transcriptional regulator with XRE-family HTH domain